MTNGEYVLIFIAAIFISAIFIAMVDDKEFL